MLLPPKTNNFMKLETKNTKKLPLWLLIVFGTFNILFGMNFGFLEILSFNVRRTVNIISKFISLYVLFLMFLTLILDENADILGRFRFTLFGLNYFFCFLTIDFCKYTVFDFLIDVRYLRNFKITNEDRILIFIYIFIMYSTGMKCYICVITCYHNKWSCLIAIIPYCFNFFIAVGSFSVLPFIHILINYYVYLQMLHLKKIRANASSKRKNCFPALR
nr:gustatory receptor 33 [Achelura yunnanensis]